MTATPRLALRLLGETSLTRDGEPMAALLRAPKRLAVLVHLVLSEPAGFRRRDALLALLWPELPQQRGRSALRNALHLLRCELGSDVIVSRGTEELAVPREAIDCDVLQLRGALGDDELERAVALYHGPLLPAFFVPDVDPDFEEWLDGERRRLARAVCNAALELSRRARDADNVAAALHWAHRACDIEPHEPAALAWLHGLQTAVVAVPGLAREAGPVHPLPPRRPLPTSDTVAWELYLEGVYQLQQRGIGPLRASIASFQRAIALDPRFAQAHAALASAWHALTFWAPADERAGRQAEIAAQRAIALDGQLADAHAVLANRAIARRAWAEADARFRHAIALAPDEPAPAHWYADFLQQVGRARDSIPHARHAVALDPVSPVRNIVLAASLLLAGSIDEARERRDTAYRLGLERDGFLPLAFAIDDERAADSIGELLGLDERTVDSLEDDARAALRLSVREAKVAGPSTAVNRAIGRLMRQPRLPSHQRFLLALLAGDDAHALEPGGELARRASWFMAGFWLARARRLRGTPAFTRLLRDIGLQHYQTQVGGSRDAGTGDQRRR